MRHFGQLDLDTMVDILRIPTMLIGAMYDTVKDISPPILLLLLATTIVSSIIFV